MTARLAAISPLLNTSITRDIHVLCGLFGHPLPSSNGNIFNGLARRALSAKIHIFHLYIYTVVGGTFNAYTYVSHENLNATNTQIEKCARIYSFHLYEHFRFAESTHSTVLFRMICSQLTFPSNNKKT